MEFNELFDGILNGMEHFGHIFLFPLSNSHLYEVIQSPMLSELLLTKSRFTTFYGYVDDARIIAATRKRLHIN